MVSLANRNEESSHLAFGASSSAETFFSVPAHRECRYPRAAPLIVTMSD